MNRCRFAALEAALQAKPPSGSPETGGQAGANPLEISRSARYPGGVPSAQRRPESGLGRPHDRQPQYLPPALS